METGRRVFGDRIAYCHHSYDALSGADALAVVTEWNEFREPDFQKIKQLLKSPVVFDGRNIYSPDTMRGLGFQYFSIGR
jgi:UDPglucose 6-dehydrogenase